MSLRVIGAGLPRTGTTSLKAALELLGFGPCYNMEATLARPAHWPLWNQALDGIAIEWEQVFSGFCSTVAGPSCWFSPELARRYPDAQLVLTIRDPDRWFDSVSSTVESEAVRKAIAASPAAELFRKMYTRTPLADREAAVEYYHAHCTAIRNAIRAERLLIYDVKQGWEPLCRFLDVPTPLTPFPRANEAADFAEHARRLLGSPRA